MRAGKSVKSLEQEILAFWAWLGASEAPEGWETTPDQELLLHRDKTAADGRFVRTPPHYPQHK